MKVHVMTIGFTPQVFTSFIRQGADRVIAIRSGNRDPQTDAVIAELERILGKRQVEVRVPKNDESFGALVKEFIGILNSIPDGAEVFVHIGGGMRHLAAALLYSTMFIDRSVTIVCTSRLPKGNKVVFEHETFPNIPLHFKLSGAKAAVLDRISKPMKLVEIVGGKLSDKEKRREMPRIHRLLKALIQDGLVEFNTETKRYSKTIAGEFTGAYEPQKEE